MPSAIVIGDGLAGLLAAIVLRRADWQVHLLRRARGERRHHAHAHQVAPGILSYFEDLAGQRLPGWHEGDALFLDPDPMPDRRCAAVVDPRVLAAGLSDAATRLGVVPSLARGSRPGLPIAQGDLIVDATGSAVLAGRTPGLAVTVDETDAIDACWTWQGAAGSGVDRWTIAASGLAGVASAWFVRFDDGRCRLTVRPGASPGTPDPRALLDAMMVAGGHDWLRRIGTVRLDPVPLRYRAPYARRAWVESPRPAALVRIGDGLVQTAPRFGQGFAQIAEQIAVLRSAARGQLEIEAAIAAIEAGADRRWLGAAFGAHGAARIAA